jgi:putative hemolysin
MKDFPLLFPTLMTLAILLLISAFFSGSETALMALNRIRLRNLVKKKVKNARTVAKLVSNLERLLASVLIGNNLVNVAISILGGMLFVKYFGERWGILIGTFAMAFVLLLFGEMIPKTFAAQRTAPFALFIAQPMRLVLVILSPIAKVFALFVNAFIRLFVRKPVKRAPLVTEEEIKLMIEVGKEEGILRDEERKILHRIFEFGDAKVSDVMIPGDQIVSVGIDSDEHELLRIITEEGYSRIPVFEKERDNIVGVIYAKELLHLWRNNMLLIVKDIVHPIHFVKKEKKIIELLREFQRMHLHISIVVDEKNKAIGLVTLEDLLEEIVGEIEEDYTSKIT